MYEVSRLLFTILDLMYGLPQLIRSTSWLHRCSDILHLVYLLYTWNSEYSRQALWP